MDDLIFLSISKWVQGPQSVYHVKLARISMIILCNNINAQFVYKYNIIIIMMIYKYQKSFISDHINCLPKIKYV